MAEQNLNIKITLKDEVSNGLVKMEKGLLGLAKSIDKTSRQLRQVGRDISQLGQTMMWTGTAMTAPLIASFKSAEKYSKPVSKELERINTVFIALRVSIAENMLPIVTKFTDGLGKMYMAWEKLNPAIKQSLINTILMSGTYLIVGGTITMIVGKIVRLGAILIGLPTKLLVFASMHPILTGIAIGLGLVVSLMIKYGDQSVSILGRIKLAWDTVAIGVTKVSIALMNVLKWQSYLSGNWKMAEFFKKGILGAEEAIRNLEKDMQEIFSSGKATGILGDLENTKEAIEKIFAGLSDLPSPDFDKLFQKFKDVKLDIEKNVQSLADVMRNTMSEVANSMGNSLGNLFGNVLSGQIKDAKQMFADFGKSVLDILGQVIAKLLITTTLGRIFPAFNLLGMKFHQGGVVKAHSGYLANDEVPIIAQRGEGILSRRAMSNLGESNFRRLNSGQGVGSGQSVNQPIIVIQAWDVQDIQRNSKKIEAIISNALSTNSPLRGKVRKYGG